jgi:hypothetical protein
VHPDQAAPIIAEAIAKVGREVSCAVDDEDLVVDVKQFIAQPRHQVILSARPPVMAPELRLE